MRRWAFLFRPGWLALALVVVAFAYLCFTVLAPWQLGKNTRTSRENNQIAASLTADPVPVTSLLSQSDSAQWRRVTATGHYVAGATVLARLRVVDGEPAFEVLTPFVIDRGPTILVDRGYARPLEGSRVPPIPPPPSTPVTITARLRDSEPRADGKNPITEDGMTQVYSINTPQVGELTGTRLADSYLQLVESQPGGLDRGQPGPEDLGLSGLDVVRHPPEAHRRRSQVDDRERRLWVAIARLPDAPRVDQRRRRQLDPASSLGDLLAFLGENSGEVRVPEEAEAAPELHQDLERLEVVKDVFPEVRLARATVHVAVRAQPPVLG